MNGFIQKPVKRKALRRSLGRIYFSCRRFFSWYFSHVKFTRTRRAPLPVRITSHKSVLLRRLRNVDMWMQHNKVRNLQLALNKLNGIVIAPGETFSFWLIVGYPAAWKGYVPAMVLQDGKVRAGTGGGLCQLSNLIFWMTLHTPLEIVERHRHSYDVFPDSSRTLPFGSGATVAYNYIDLQIKNNTAQEFQLNLYMDDTHLHGEWLSETGINYSYEILEKEQMIQSEFWGGYTRRNKLFRKTTDRVSGETVSEELLYENHAVLMYNPLLEQE